MSSSQPRKRSRWGASTDITPPSSSSSSSSTASSSVTTAPPSFASPPSYDPNSNSKKAQVYSFNDITSVNQTSVLANTAESKKARTELMKDEMRNQARIENGKPEKEAAPVETNPYLSHLNNTKKVSTPGYDPSIKVRTAKTSSQQAKKSTFNFIVPGKFVTLGEKARTKAAGVGKAGFSSGRKDGTGTFAPSVSLTPSSSSSSSSFTSSNTIGVRADCINPPPIALDWWDVDLLPLQERLGLAKMEKARKLQILKSKISSKSTTTTSEADKAEPTFYPDLDEDIRPMLSVDNIKTLKYVQHPITIKPLSYNPNATPLAPTVFLTKSEIKRKRRLARADKQRDLRDLQALGLVPVPQPKLTLSNFMRAVGDAAVTDPSKMERIVKNQVDSRRIAHDKMNADRALTKTEKRNKMRQKRLGRKSSNNNGSEGWKADVYEVGDLSHRYHRTKIDLFCMQNDAYGLCLEVRNCGKDVKNVVAGCEGMQFKIPIDKGGDKGKRVSLLIVESGGKTSKRLARLVSSRMRWRGEGMNDDSDESSSDESEGDENDENQPVKNATQKFNKINYVKRLWEGIAIERKFTSFSFAIAKSVAEGKTILDLSGYGHMLQFLGKGSDVLGSDGGGMGTVIKWGGGEEEGAIESSESEEEEGGEKMEVEKKV